MTYLLGLGEAFFDEADDDVKPNGEETAEEGVDIPDDVDVDAPPA